MADVRRAPSQPFVTLLTHGRRRIERTCPYGLSLSANKLMLTDAQSEHPPNDEQPPTLHRIGEFRHGIGK
jgi:hypothetical protein